MTAPGDIVGQAIVNVRTCLAPVSACPRMPDLPDHLRCPGCQGDGTWVDTSNPTMVERVDVFIQWGSGYMGTAELEIEPDPEGNYFRPVENGDTDE